ncbi:MAG: HAD-IIA family hydrolase [Burkholderiaceae bacterium]
MSHNDPTSRIQIACAALAQARHLLIDLDGTLIRQHEPIRGAAELLERFQDRFAIVSNNSTHTAASLSRRLRRQGLRVPPDRIVLAGELAVRQLARTEPDARVLAVTSPVIHRLARAHDCHLVQADADVVLLALDTHFNHARLALVANELRQGARLIVSNTDSTHPGANGHLVPETGALLAAVMAASGEQPWRVIGKPEPLLFEEAMRRLGASPGHTLVIGDNAQTDGIGAARLGLRCLLVGDSPTAVAPSVAGLLGLPESPDQYRLSDSTSNVRRSVLTEVS